MQGKHWWQIFSSCSPRRALDSHFRQSPLLIFLAGSVTALLVPRILSSRNQLGDGGHALDRMSSPQKYAFLRPLFCVTLLALARLAICPSSAAETPGARKASSADEPVSEGSWRFIVSGDSR